MKNKYCTLYIVRHGETEWNVRHLFQGQRDSVLTNQGKRQAKVLREKFKKIKFDKVFSSDLLRAKNTAEIIVLEHKIAIETKKVLRERRFGKLEGRKSEEVVKELKDLFEKFEKISDEEKLKFRFVEDMESDEEIIARLISFLREISLVYAGKTVLIITHGGIIRTLLIHLGFGTYKELPNGSVGNTGYVKLLSDGIDFFVKETEGVQKSQISKIKSQK